MNRLASRGRSRRSIDDGDNDSMSDNSNRSSSVLKGRFKMKRGSSRSRIRLMDDGDSESVSDVSVDTSSSVRSSISKYESIRSKMKRAGDKLKRGTSRPRGRTEPDDGCSDSVSEYSMGSRYSEVSRYKSVRSTLKRAGSKIVRKKTGEHLQPSILDIDGAEQLVGSTIISQSDDTKAHAMGNLMKNAKSRFNIGIVYLKTGDYEKSRENLEHSLHCHTQLAGHDTKSYTRETLFAIAAVHEKLGDCYSAKSNISNNSIAVGNYQESRRLLQLIDPEDASDNVIEMLERVGDQLKSPGLRGIEGRRRPLPQTNDSNSREMYGNADMNDPSSPSPPKFEKSTDANKLNFVANIMVGKFKGDELDRTCSSESLSDSDAENFAHAMLYSDRSDHQMAFDHLSSMQVLESMNNIGFRDEFVSNMMTMASSALGAGKTRLAVDAFEAAYTLLKTLQAESTTKEKWQSLLVKSKLPSSNKSCMPGVHSDLVFARRGCIKSHKAMALDMESAMDYESAIQQRIRVKDLLEEDEQCIPACKQLMKIAYLHGEKKCDYDQCSSILGVLAQKL
jgi:tetratricopeptide (TPR) repeat protein